MGGRKGDGMKVDIDGLAANIKASIGGDRKDEMRFMVDELVRHTKTCEEDCRALLRLVDEAIELFGNVNWDATQDRFEEDVRGIRNRVLETLAQEIQALQQGAEHD